MFKVMELVRIRAPRDLKAGDVIIGSDFSDPNDISHKAKVEIVEERKQLPRHE